MARDASNVPACSTRWAASPAVVKLLRGTQGVGVMLASTIPELQEFSTLPGPRSGVRAPGAGGGVHGAVTSGAGRRRGWWVRCAGAPSGASSAAASTGNGRGGGRGSSRRTWRRRSGDRGRGAGSGRGGSARDTRGPDASGGELQPRLRGARAGNWAGRRGRHHRPGAGTVRPRECRDAARALSLDASAPSRASSGVPGAGG